MHQVTQCRLELRLNLRHARLSQIETTEEEVLPWGWRIDHRQRPVELEVQIVRLVQLLDKFFHKGLVEGDVTNIFFGFATWSILALRTQELRLEQHKISIAALELKGLCHQVAQVCTDLDLHWLRH